MESETPDPIPDADTVDHEGQIRAVLRATMTLSLRSMLVALEDGMSPTRAMRLIATYSESMGRVYGEVAGIDGIDELEDDGMAAMPTFRRRVARGARLGPPGRYADEPRRDPMVMLQEMLGEANRVQQVRNLLQAIEVASRLQGEDALVTTLRAQLEQLMQAEGPTVTVGAIDEAG